MSFGRRSGPFARAARPPGFWQGCQWGLGLFLRMIVSGSVIAALAVGVLYLRLQQGPVTLPGLDHAIATGINAEAAGEVISIGDAVLSLGGGNRPALYLRDVAVSDAAGVQLFSLPEVGVRVRLADLVEGRLQPTEISIIAPDATLTRAEDGLLSFRMGDGVGFSLAPDMDDETPDSDEVFENAVRILSGEVAGPEAFAALERIVVDGARLTYDDRQNGGKWQTGDAEVEILRDTDGVRAKLSVAVIDNGRAGAAVQLLGAHKRGADVSTLEARFGRIGTNVISGQLPALAWLRVVDGTVEGRARAEIAGDGTVTGLEGVLIAENGSVQGIGPEAAFDIAEVNFTVDPLREVLLLERVRLSSAGVDTTLSGVAGLRRDATGEVASLAGQLDVGNLYLRLPEVFSDELSFDDGQINFRWSLMQDRIEVVDTRLSNGAGVFLVEGRAQEGADGWITDFRAEAVNMTVPDLIAHWPVAAAAEARDWVATNIPQGRVDTFLAQMRLGDGEPYLTLDFDFSDAVSTYIPGMPPIFDARGQGHMTYHGLYLTLTDGYVTPPGGDAISLAGSDLEISNFWGEVTPADIDLAATGRISDILALIDLPPLSLISKLGLPLDGIRGTGEVRAALSFPLISDLLVEDVQADASAVLRDLAMSAEIAPGRAVGLTASRLDLAANVQEMRLQGRLAADGVPVTLDWHEFYGATPSRRTLALNTTLSRNLLALADMSKADILAGTPLAVRLTQRGQGPLAFALDADLRPLDLDLPAIGWSKPSGRAGTLSANGSLGDGVRVDRLDLKAGGLIASGALTITPEGDLGGATFTRLALPGLGDVAGSLASGDDGVWEVRLTSGSIDLSQQTGDSDTPSSGPAVRIRLDIDRLKLTEKIALGRTSGTVERRADGHLAGALDSVIGTNIPVSVSIERPAAGAGQLSLSSPNAGSLLDAAGIYRGVRGGTLALDARFGGDSGPDAVGTLSIRDVVVRSESTFRDVLRDGGLTQEESEVSSSGIRFRKVSVPFVYQDGLVTLTDAIASSPLLALKLNGTLDETTEVLDMVGVLSPAYVLTGFLDEIPVLGRLFSGGRGEGILAMTFTLTGPLEDPAFVVNPLSLLTPGVLRDVFERRATPSESSFVDRLSTSDDR